MKRSERRLWRSARTLQDLGDLMARWLEGDIGSQPGYQPRYGPEPETTDLIETLAACNRAGYLTISSQPGLITDDLQQRAAVQGFTDDLRMLRRLERLGESAGLLTAVHLTAAPSEPVDGFIATISEGEPCTGFGCHLATSDLYVIWSGCHRTAADAVIASYQVTLIDPEYGRNDLLWTVLDEASGRSGPICTWCGCTEHTPCPGGCTWLPFALEPVCSACSPTPLRVPVMVDEMVDEAAAILNGPALAPDDPVRLSVQSLFRQVMERGMPDLTEQDQERTYQRFLAVLDGHDDDQPECGPEYLDDDSSAGDDFGDGERECAGCGAPYYRSGCDGPYCTWVCAEVGAEADAYVAPVDLVKHQHQSWGWPVGELPF
jgi:hypothetical protein